MDHVLDKLPILGTLDIFGQIQADKGPPSMFGNTFAVLWREKTGGRMGDLQDPIEDGGTDSIYVWPIFQG